MTIHPCAYRSPRLLSLAAVLLLVLVGSVACGQPTHRVLQRDPIAGGPAGVAVDDLGPLFEDATIQDALRDLDAGRAGPAIASMRGILESGSEQEHRAEATFALGYALHVGGEHEDAIPVLVECANVAPLFIDYCMYWAALSALTLEDPAAAEAYAATVEPRAVFGPRSRHVRGRALAAADRHADAVRVFEDFIADHPDAWYRNAVEFDLAASQVALGDFDAAAHIYRRIALVNPGSSDEVAANLALAGIEQQLSTRVREALADRTPLESLERARVLFDRHRSDEVIALLEPVVQATEPGTDVFCEASYLVGKSHSKLRHHSDSLPWYVGVVDNCDDDDLVVKSLYNAGRGSWNIDANDAAFALFERLWTEHAANSYADDAMLYGARILRGEDDEEGYVALLRRQIETFPGGDMLGDAVWLLAQRLYMAGEYRETIRFIDELGSRTGERGIYSRGRLSYFRARSQEALSLRGEARAGYAEIVREHPMAYYALLSLERLRSADADAAVELLDSLRGETEHTEDFIRVEPEEAARDPFFVRGTSLLRLGLFTLAEGEFGKLESRFPNEDEIGWVAALLYHRAGAFHLSHHVPGERLDLNLAYPAGSNLERWRIAYPLPFEDQVSAAANERDLDRFAVYAIMREESGFRPEIESWANARGLLQLMLGTANDMAALTGRGSVSASELFDPGINIELGTMFMRTLADRYRSHPCLIFAGYNGGHGNVNGWLRARGDLPLDVWVEEIPYSQTRNYVKRVTMSYWVYRWLYGDPDVPIAFDLSGLP